MSCNVTVDSDLHDAFVALNNRLIKYESSDRILKTQELLDLAIAAEDLKILQSKSKVLMERVTLFTMAQFRLCVGKPSGSIFDLKNLQLRTCESLDIASSPGIAVNTLSRPL